VIPLAAAALRPRRRAFVRARAAVPRWSLLLLAATAMTALSGCVDSHDATSAGVPLPTDENSCAIRCAKATAAPARGVAAAVTCDEGWAPVCQCADPARPRAGCEPAPTTGTSAR
jgi:hypothetical protein